MPEEPLEIEIILEGDERYLLKTFADGSEERTPRKRFPHRKWSSNKSKKGGFKR